MVVVGEVVVMFGGGSVVVVEVEVERCKATVGMHSPPIKATPTPTTHYHPSTNLVAGVPADHICVLYQPQVEHPRGFILHHGATNEVGVKGGSSEC